MDEKVNWTWSTQNPQDPGKIMQKLGLHLPPRDHPRFHLNYQKMCCEATVWEAGNVGWDFCMQFSMIQIKASSPPPLLSSLFPPHTTFVFIALIGKVTHADAFLREQIIICLQNNSGASKQPRHYRNCMDLQTVSATMKEKNVFIVLYCIVMAK